MFKFLGLVLSLSLSATAYADSFKNVDFDLNASSIKWTGKKITGSHNGIVKLKAATGSLKQDNSVQGKFEVDMTSLKVTDIESPKDNKKLTEHLTSPDFFKVIDFPVVSFNITDSKPIPGATSGNPNVNITGQLSIKGITQEINFPAVVQVNERNVKASGIATVDRTKFDVRYGSGKFFDGLGDKLIYDDFTLDIDLQGKIT